MKMKTLFLLLFMVLPVMLATACTKPSNYSNVYSRGSISATQDTITGTVLSKRAVTIEGGTGIGEAAGGVIGAIAGSHVGGGEPENTVGGIAGALIGGTLGSIAENSLLSAEGVEYIVETDEKGLITIIMNDNAYRVGDFVFVVLGDQPKIVGSPSLN